MNRLSTNLTRRAAWISLAIAVVLGAGFADSWSRSRDLAAADGGPDSPVRYRSPVEVVLFEQAGWLVTANQTANSLSLIRLDDGSVVDEVSCGDHPVAVRRCLDDAHVLVSCAHAGKVMLFAIEENRLLHKGTADVGYEPRGLAVQRASSKAFVGLFATGEVAEIDLQTMNVVRRVSVGRWPNQLALSKDGRRLAVGCSGESRIKVMATDSGEILYEEPLSSGINIGQMQLSADGLQVYFPWMVYRSNPINPRNIRQGWVLASRIGRVRMDGPSYREAISLDVPGKAVADPYGLVIGPDGHRLVVSASGTHELLVYRLNDLPFVGVGGPGDLIDRQLMNDRDLFYRIELGGRPMGMAISADSRTVYVANYLRDSVQVVDVESREVVRELQLGQGSSLTAARRGMELFYDGRRSLDQWYSCHSCHQDGGLNSKSMDTMNDGTELTPKTVLPLYQVDQTGPWTWHGWQTDLRDSIRRSFTTTMKGSPITDDEVEAVLAYLHNLTPPPNPFRQPDGSLSEAAERGKIVFEGRKAGCADCHFGPRFTDGEVHDLGLGGDGDRYVGFNTPTLIGAYRKIRYLHDGRAKTLESVLTGAHAPEKVAGDGGLSEQELNDLIEYLKSL